MEKGKLPSVAGGGIKRMKKLVLVINGSGGVGKDTLCYLAARYFKVENISSITPIKEIAATCGWNGEKDDRARRFLSDLKQLTVAYNDYPTNWIYEKYTAFLKSDAEILFVHIREGEEIRKFVEKTKGDAKTLLIRGGKRFQKRDGNFGNRSDDEVENYTYDYYFLNEKPLREVEPLFIELLRSILAKEK